eukprot:COSAG01_NODE_7967_length_2971_cov_31.735724_3_plen_119_part_00
MADARGASSLGGQHFQAAMRTPSIAEALDDETAILLFVIAVATQSEFKSAKGPQPMLQKLCSSAIVAPCTTGDGDAARSAMVDELAGIHAALFPALTTALPDAFPAEHFTVRCLGHTF